MPLDPYFAQILKLSYRKNGILLHSTLSFTHVKAVSKLFLFMVNSPISVRRHWRMIVCLSIGIQVAEVATSF